MVKCARQAHSQILVKFCAILRLAMRLRDSVSGHFYDFDLAFLYAISVQDCGADSADCQMRNDMDGADLAGYV